jgi:hypothetical protein
MGMSQPCFGSANRWLNFTHKVAQRRSDPQYSGDRADERLDAVEVKTKSVQKTKERQSG